MNPRVKLPLSSIYDKFAVGLYLERLCFSNEGIWLRSLLQLKHWMYTTTKLRMYKDQSILGPNYVINFGP